MKTPEQWLDSILTDDIPAEYDSTLLHLIQAIQKDAVESTLAHIQKQVLPEEKHILDQETTTYT